MGKILIPGSGSGADLDVITAEASDVLAPKVTVDRDGELVTGTLALTGSAQAGDVRPGRTFYTTNPKAIQSGTMAERGAATYTPSTYNQVIQGNQYLTGAQTVLGDGNLASQYIKKGVTIFGVTGSFEGYVPTPTDLYLRGNNIAGWSKTYGSVDFQAGQIRFNQGDQGYGIKSASTFNFTGYSRIVVYTSGRLDLYHPSGINTPYTQVRIGDTYLPDVALVLKGDNVIFSIPINTAIANIGTCDLYFFTGTIETRYNEANIYRISVE